jgi:hypothetical protein
MAKKSTSKKIAKLVKPQLQYFKPSYNFNDCTKYIEQKYGYQTRGYISIEEKGLDDSVEIGYRDFWHWILDRHEIHNGCYIEFSKYDLDMYKEYGDINDWEAKIYQDYLNEFADENGEINFYVWW